MAEVLTLLLAKVRAPIIVAAAFGSIAAWSARGVMDDHQQSVNDVAAALIRLDSVTVKRPEFDRLVIELRSNAAKTDSTNALLRRLICQRYPSICP